MERNIAIFIDGAYLDKIQEGAGLRVDMTKLINFMLGEKKDRLLRAYYYNSIPYETADPEDQKRARARHGYYSAIRDATERLDIRLTPSVARTDAAGVRTLKQKGADVQLATDCAMLCARGTINEAIFIAGDADFVPLVNAIKAMGVGVCLFHGPRSSAGSSTCTVSREMLRVADERVELTAAMMYPISVAGSALVAASA